MREAKVAVAQRLGEHDLIVAGIPQVLSAQQTIAIHEEGGPLSSDLLLEHGLAELVLLLLRQNFAALERGRKLYLIMLVCDHTVIKLPLHSTCNKRVIGIEDKVSLIIVIVILFMWERKEVRVLPRPLFVCVGYQLGTDERLHDGERRRRRFFFAPKVSEV